MLPRGTGERYGRAKSPGPRAQVRCTTWYGQPYGAFHDGPRKGRTVPVRTLRGAFGTFAALHLLWEHYTKV
jgi:hypothetical protein